MKNIFLSFLMFTVFSSCSRLDLAFDYAPRYMANNLEDAFDLSSDRYKKMKETIRQDLSKNKEGLLSDVIAKIDEALVLTDKKELSSVELKKFNAQVRALQAKAVYAFKDSFSELILSLSRKEFDHLKEYSAEKFEKADERILDQEKFTKHSMDSFKKIMDVLFDSTNKQQIDIYKKFINDNYDFYKNQIVMRKQFLNQFESIFDKKPELLSYVLKHYAGDESVKSADYLKRQQKLLENFVQLELDIWNASSDKQKEAFKKSLNEIKDELKGLLVKP